MWLPVRVISDLLGVEERMRGRFKATIDAIWNTTATPQEAVAAAEAVHEMLGEHVRAKRARPADDLTSTLIATRDDEADGTALTERELVDTLLLVVAAGYETTVNLIDSAVTALLADPAQLAHVREGRATWSDVVEETLRLAPPAVGAPLARAEGAAALAGLFGRFPEVRLAVPAAELEPLPSILGNGRQELPVRLG